MCDKLPVEGVRKSDYGNCLVCVRRNICIKDYGYSAKGSSD